MSYENEKRIKQFFEGVHEEDELAELNEVYAKSKAFDEVHEVKVTAIKDCNYLVSPKFFKMFGMRAFRKLEDIKRKHERRDSDEL